MIPMTQANTSISLRRNDVVLAYTFLRVILGVNFFNHGFTRIGNIPGFVNGMVETFQDTFIPPFLVQINAFLVSPVELVFGLLLAIGLLTRLSLVVLLGLMFVLMYGVTLLQNWDAATSQLIYDALLCTLLAGLTFNDFSVDRWRQGRAAQEPVLESSGVLRFMPGFLRGRRRRSFSLGRSLRSHN
jgi:thiosulfate dehydrogenase [quinone] large subunit